MKVVLADPIKKVHSRNITREENVKKEAENIVKNYNLSSLESILKDYKNSEKAGNEQLNAIISKQNLKEEEMDKSENKEKAKDIIGKITITTNNSDSEDNKSSVLNDLPDYINSIINTIKCKNGNCETNSEVETEDENKDNNFSTNKQVLIIKPMKPLVECLILLESILNEDDDEELECNKRENKPISQVYSEIRQQAEESGKKAAEGSGDKAAENALNQNKANQIADKIKNTVSALENSYRRPSVQHPESTKKKGFTNKVKDFFSNLTSKFKTNEELIEALCKSNFSKEEIYLITEALEDLKLNLTEEDESEGENQNNNDWESANKNAWEKVKDIIGSSGRTRGKSGSCQKAYAQARKDAEDYSFSNPWPEPYETSPQEHDDLVINNFNNLSKSESTKEDIIKQGVLALAALKTPEAKNKFLSLFRNKGVDLNEVVKAYQKSLKSGKV